MSKTEFEIITGTSLPPGEDELPCDDAEPLESERHRVQMQLLIDTLNDEWAGRSDVYVGGNMFIYFSELQAKHNDFRGPDVFVVTGTRRRERKSWVVWQEDGRLPDVVVELTSESTARIDRGEKMRLYEGVLKVDLYCIYEPGADRVEVFHRVDGRYRPLAPDAAGRFEAAPIGMKLGLWMGTHRGLEGPWLRWFRADGSMVPTGAERAEAERTRAEAAEARAAALEAELAALRGRPS
jgi:Uma2 family endonuclease